MLEFSVRFGTNPHRRELLSGFLKYRAQLRNVVVDNGRFVEQWVDGSFVEESVTTPNDIDLVNLFYDPEPPESARLDELISSEYCREQFKCDAFPMSVRSKASSVKQLAYWLGLFGHRREPPEWKGMVVIPLHDDAGRDSEALQWLHDQGDES